MIDPRFYWGFLAISSVFVFLRGGAPERIGIAIVFAGSVLSFIAGTLEGREFGGFEISVFLVDVAVLGAFVLLALRADRFWPIGVAALQIAGVTSHIAELSSSRIIAWVYSIGQALWCYPIILLILWGTLRHRKRLAKLGVDNSWTRSSRVARPPMPQDGPAA